MVTQSDVCTTKSKNNNLSIKLEELREFLRGSTITKPQVWLKKNVGNWDMLWSAFDNIQDSQEAIDQFPALNAEYLGVYGLLQAMIVQQDSIQNLANALGRDQIKWSEYPELLEIRKVRISTIGHPTDIKKKKDSTYENDDISYSSMTIGVMRSEILEYVEWSSSGAKSKKVDLRSAINQQEEILISLIGNILNDIQEKEIKHIKQFADDSIENSLSNCGYFISKLWPFERERLYSKSCFELLIETFENFKNKLQERYGYDSFEFQPGLQMEIEKIEKLLPKIETLIPMESDIDELDMEVYIESLQHSFDELKTMAKEIDQKFSYQPKKGK